MRKTRVVVATALVVFSAGCSDAVQDEVEVDTSTSVSVPDTTIAAPDPNDTEGPPAIRVDTGSSTVMAPGFDYCWNPGGCADWFGTEVPTPIYVDAPSVSISWIDGGVLTARYSADDQECDSRRSLEPAGPGVWNLEMPPAPGTHMIDFHGEAAGGTSQFALLVSSSAAGPPPLPIASVWWPNTDSEFVVGAEFHTIDPDSEVLIEIISTDEISTFLDVQLYAPDSGCAPFIEGHSAAVDGISSLGAAPYQATLTVRSGADQYEMTWEWPRDIDPRDTVTGTLSPAP